MSKIKVNKDWETPPINKFANGSTLIFLRNCTLSLSKSILSQRKTLSCTRQNNMRTLFVIVEPL